MKPCFLFRSELDVEHEIDIASQYLPTYTYRSLIPGKSVVIGRYSVLPFYKELSNELKCKGSNLVNSPSEHAFIANVLEWGSDNPYSALYGLTPKSWDQWHSIPEGAYVVKGCTNSRKHQWNTRMFAPNKAAIADVVSHLLDDVLIADQGIVVREYVPLKTIEVGLNGLPITNEWRTFWYRDQMLCKGFYWASHPHLESQARWSEAAEKLAHEAARRVSEHATFFVLDLAETEKGDWIVIEVNDGQMSGLSACDPHELYGNLAKLVQMTT